MCYWDCFRLRLLAPGWCLECDWVGVDGFGMTICFSGDTTTGSLDDPPTNREGGDTSSKVTLGTGWVRSICFVCSTLWTSACQWFVVSKACLMRLSASICACFNLWYAFTIASAVVTVGCVYTCAWRTLYPRVVLLLPFWQIQREFYSAPLMSSSRNRRPNAHRMFSSC